MEKTETLLRRGRLSSEVVFPKVRNSKTGAWYHDLTGQRFGRLVAIARTDLIGDKQGAQWLCQCDCGNRPVVRGRNLIRLDAQSCGCILKELRASGVFRRTHGLRRTRQYHMHHAAKIRASKTDVPFNIDLADIIIPDRCPVLGIVFDSGGRETSPSIDRIKPELGYVLDNIRVISNRANRLKSDASVEELRRILDYCEGRI